MPDDYPWLVSDVMIEGYTEITQSELDDLYAIDKSAYDHYTSTASIQPVTPRQMRTALVLSGFSIQTIETAIGTLPEPDKSIAMIAWEYSLEFQRNNSLIISMSPLLGLTPAQIDDLFALAKTL